MIKTSHIEIPAHFPPRIRAHTLSPNQGNMVLAPPELSRAYHVTYRSVKPAQLESIKGMPGVRTLMKKVALFSRVTDSRRGRERERRKKRIIS